MRNCLHRRALGYVVALVLVAAPLVVATAAFGADPGVQSTATVANGEELREQWAIGNNTLITLTADIDLGVDGEGHDICDGDEPIRTGGEGIVVDGQGLYGITQTCKGQRVLRDDSGGETVTLQGLTHFTGGEAYGNGGGLRNDGPVNVVNSDVSGNEANNTCLEKLDAGAQVVICEAGNGGGIFAGVPVSPYLVENGYDIHLTNSTVADNTATDNGGGLYTAGALTTAGSHLSGNTAGGWAEGSGMGGGAFADDTVSSTDTSWTNNDAQCNIFSEPAEPVTAADPAVCGAVASGGGFFTYGSATVSGSTFTDNHAYDSGGGFLAHDADVSSSTFTGNSAGGISSLEADVNAAQLPGPLASDVTAADEGSQDCLCSGGGFAVGSVVDEASVPTHGASVVNSTFVGNSALCNQECFGSGGGFYSAGGATVSGSMLGDSGDDSNGNQAGCFAECGASGGGAYVGGGAAVDTTTFGSNFAGCFAACGAEGGGLFSGNGSSMITSIDGLSAAVPDVQAAVAGDGSTNVVQSTFTGNSAFCILGECDGSGGGLFASESPTVDVTASTFNANEAIFDGGAISVNGGFVFNVICDAECGSTVTITNSTVAGNTSGFPAAVSVGNDSDTLTLINDTIDSNSIQPQETDCVADSICSAGEAKAAECECFAANVFAFDLTSFGTDITHPILEASAEPVATFDDIANCWVEDSTSEGFNFSDDDSCEFTDSTDNVSDGNDPMLGALADNGGPTQTMLPQPGSPLIDAIQPVSECQVDVDQRGVSRPQIKGCDTGAVEVLGASLRVDKVVTGTAGNPVPANGYSFSVSCTDGTATSVSVADATAGGSSETVNDILPGAVCTVTEAPVAYTNANVVSQPVVSYDPAVGSPLGEGDTEVVTVTNNYEGINLLGIAVNLIPKFTG